MKKSISIFLLCVCQISAGSSDSLIYADTNRQNPAKYFLVNNLRISEIPSCQKKVCLAFQIATRKMNVPNKFQWTPGGGNPTATLCKNMKAEPKIGYMPNGNEVSLCYFKDGSFIFGWDLFLLMKNENR